MRDTVETNDRFYFCFNYYYENSKIPKTFLKNNQFEKKIVFDTLEASYISIQIFPVIRTKMYKGTQTVSRTKKKKKKLNNIQHHLVYLILLIVYT